MEKIVNEAVKVDLHIHSCYSSGKDGNKVAANTEKNISILVKGLIDNEVNIAAITDHDTFSYSMYSELKKQEQKKNCIKKILPGIEFTVEYAPNIPIHIVTIFDDSNDEKVKNIETIMTTGIGFTKYSKKKKQFKKKDYIDILDEIGLDFVMIAHQKSSLLSKDGPKQNDVRSLNDKDFNEVIFMDYFDAFEFRNKKNELYNKVFQIDNNLEDNVRFITGSDCHRWENYPYTEDNEKQNFTFTYLKSLPTFRGLAMAITDNHRIAFEEKFFNPLEKHIDKLQLEIEGKMVDIPLSKGINVIIGDNSIGKSLFLHELTSNYKLTKNKQLQTGYKKYLAKKNISIKTKISEEDIFMFNAQGEIRAIFDKDGLQPDTYLKQFYPDEINAAKYRNDVENELQRLYSALEAKFQYDQHKKLLPDLTIDTSEYVPISLTFTGKKLKHSEKDTRDLVDKFEKVQDDFEQIKKNKALLDKDKEQIESIQETISIMQEKYSLKLNDLIGENAKINIYTTFINKYKNQYSRKLTDEQAVYSEFLAGKDKIIDAIVALKKEERSLVKYSPANLNESIEVVTNDVDRFKFVSKLGVEKIDSNYITNLINVVLKKNKKIDTLTITEAELEEWIKNNADSENQIEALKTKINAVLDKEFAPRNSIIESGMDVYQEVSSGFDAQMYFTLISGEANDKGIYIIDQPEDHISQKAIKNKVLNQFRRMGGNRQVIMVTHNPQFIINLDVDNVIFLSNEDGKFCVKSGALEYEDADYSILDIVAENVEGGLAQIQGRLKRYEKKLYTE